MDVHVDSGTLFLQELEAQSAASAKACADSLADAEHFATQLAALQAASVQAEHEHRAAMERLQARHCNSGLVPTANARCDPSYEPALCCEPCWQWLNRGILPE